MKNILFLLLSLMSCVHSKQSPSKCRYKAARLKLIMPSVTEAYQSMELFVYADSLSVNCTDSAELMNVINGYLKETTFDYRISDLFLYSDTSKFDFGEPLSQKWSEVNKSCIVGLRFNEKMVIEEFYFYDNNGQQCYEGPLWRPCR
jgi:hypothetical protein